MRGLLGIAYRRPSAASAGLREFRKRFQDPSFLAPFVFSDTTGSKVSELQSSHRALRAVDQKERTRS